MEATMSDLPNRDENGYFGQDRYAILTAYTRGELKTRAEMDEEAVDIYLDDTPQWTTKGLLDAAFGVSDE
jgi:hypothetical protein